MDINNIDATAAGFSSERLERITEHLQSNYCLLYTSDAADE